VNAGDTVRNNPNASLSTAVASLVTGVLEGLATTGVVSQQVVFGSVITGGVVSVSLLIGRRGVRGLCMWVWRGETE